MCPKRSLNVNQTVNTGPIIHSQVTINVNAPSYSDVRLAETPGELSERLEQLAAQLEEQAYQHAGIQEALNELRAASAESRKRRPDGSAVGRLLGHAKALLAGIESVAGPISSVMMLIEQLSQQVPRIFGR